jgi:hypothetical protein
MHQITNCVIDVYKWAQRDYQDWPFRFYIEVVAWALSIGCCIVMAVTVPNPPLVVMYPIWIVGCSMYCWASWTRGSFGMVANYMLIVCIDSCGLIRMLVK